jgi:hypothetical protein
MITGVRPGCHASHYRDHEISWIKEDCGVPGTRLSLRDHERIMITDDDTGGGGVISALKFPSR